MDTEQFKYTGERFADIQMLRYRLTGFSSLSLRQKIYIYYLSEATLAGRDITFDQFGEYNLLIRNILEAIYLKYDGNREGEEFQALVCYLKRVWFSSGIHHHYGCEKFVPGFSEDFFRNVLKDTDALQHCDVNHTDCKEVIDTVCDVIFNSNRFPKRVNLAEGDDLVETSACNYYQHVTQKEAEEFYAAMGHKDDNQQPSYGLNTTLVRDVDGSIKEHQWRIGGKYSKQVSHIVENLQKASEYVENDQQRKIITLLIEYYTTGDLRTFDRYSIEWLKETEGRVDFVNGFIEVYGDPLGIKGSWEGIVEYKDLVATERTKKICQNAQWFEDHSPIDARFRKSVVKGVTANVICAAMLGGDEYPASAIGINLPNADWIRAQYGSKSVTIGNLTEAYSKAARGNGMRQEFIDNQEIIDLIDKYGDVCDDLHTDLHECLGHGSGQILPGVDTNALRAYGSTIEEARADLFGLYYLADEKLVELGLVPDAEAYKAQYYSYMLNGLMTQQVRIKLGAQIEESHMRNRAIIARWVMQHSDGNVRLEKHDGKTFLHIDNLAMLRPLFTQLLAEVQRIKSEGDYEAAKNLVEEYGVKLDKELHQEVLNRYEALNIAPYKGFINPVLTPQFDADGNITDIRVDYTESYTDQMLRYSREY